MQTFGSITPSSGYILALDLGTTGNRAFVFNADGEMIGQAYKELTQYYPQPGWLEHDPEEIWRDTCWVMQTAIKNAQIKPSAIAALGLTVQRETCLIWDKTTGQCTTPAFSPCGLRSDRLSSFRSSTSNQRIF
jgi:glycerol kinase